MREIKFRAWDKQEKQMAKVTGIVFSDVQDTLVRYQYTNHRGKRIDDQSHIDDRGHGCVELMQYIGVKDKYNREIYEGDVIQTYFSFAPGDAGYGVSQMPFVVKWEQGRAGFRAYKPNTQDWHLLDTIDFFEMQSSLYEVIGNIHENPEILEVDA